jgi:hypothetical protein
VAGDVGTSRGRDATRICVSGSRSARFILRQSGIKLVSIRSALAAAEISRSYENDALLPVLRIAFLGCYLIVHPCGRTWEMPTPIIRQSLSYVRRRVREKAIRA